MGYGDRKRDSFVEGRSMMFRPERNASPFSLLDMDMWDTNLTAQSSAWCGRASVSGSGFMSKVNSSSSSSPGSFRQSDPGLRKWQSLSHLTPNVSSRSFSPSPQSDLRSGCVHSPFRQTGVMQWLQEAQERMDSDMDLLRTDPRLNSAHLLDMKPRERHFYDTELFKLKQSLREAETRVKRQEEDHKQTLQKLQMATEVQKSLLNQTTELKQRLTQTIQNQSELQDQLREANNKISQAFLEKATLSTQVLKLEDTLHELKTKLSTALHDKDNLVQERADLLEKANFYELHLEKNIPSTVGCEQLNGQDPSETDDEETAFLKQEAAALRQINEDLTNELEELKQIVKKSHVQIQELTTAKGIMAQQIFDLEKDCVEMTNKIKAGGQEDMEKVMEELTQLRSQKFENQRQKDRCLFLETEIFEKEQQLKLLEDKHRRIDAERVKHIEELQAVVSHWTEKWQKSALALRCIEAERDKLRKINKSESEALLRLELDACKQELELVKSRGQTLLNTNTERGGDTVQSQDKETQTDSCLSQTALYIDFLSKQGEQLVEKPAGCDEKEEDCADAQIIESLKLQLEENKQTATQLEHEKTLTVQKLEALKQQSLTKDERLPSEVKRGVEVETEQQQRLVNEELKSLFKDRKANEIAESEDGSTQDWSQMPRATRGALHDRWSWLQSTGLMPVYEEEEPGDEGQDGEKTIPQLQKMLTLRVKNSDNEAQCCEPQEPDMLRTKPTIKGLEAFAEQVSQICTDVSELHKTSPLLCPDGIFHVEMVDICSPDEDEVD